MLNNVFRIVFKTGLCKLILNKNED